MSIVTHIFQTPYGELIIGDYRGRLCLCDWRYRKMRQAVDRRLKLALKSEYVVGVSRLIELTMEQLNEYFQRQRTIFELPLFPVGTEFQQKVWQELLKIPYGHTDTYLSLSTRIGNPNAVRAVAGANGANAISIIIPCHRIIGSRGELVGYAGGIGTKQKLLGLERGEEHIHQLTLF